MIPQAAQAVDAGAAPSCQPSPRGFPELKAGSSGGFIPVEILLLQTFPCIMVRKINSEPFSASVQPH